MGSEGFRMRVRVLSDCCDAPVLVRGRTTQWYTCMECEKPCDAKPVVKPEKLDGN